MSGIWLVRHGMLPPNPERRMVGARDIPLSNAGREQIRLLARQFMPAVQGLPISNLLLSYRCFLIV